MTALLIILGVAALVIWLSTIQFFEPEQGQLAVMRRFKKHILIIGNGIPEIEISKEIFDVPGVNLEIKIDSQRDWYLTIWPYNIAVFSYKRKRFTTIDKILGTNGELVWQPKLRKDENEKEIPNGPKTIGLGEWTERKKISLFALEREEVALPFLTKDGYRGTAFAYMKYVVWDISAAISATYQFKIDPEKSTFDKFQRWARGVEYLTELYGVSFEELPAAKDFYKKVNGNNST